MSWADVRRGWDAAWGWESPPVFDNPAWREERHRRPTPRPAPPQEAILQVTLTRLDQPAPPSEGGSRMARLTRQIGDKVKWKIWELTWRPLLALFLILMIVEHFKH